MTQQTVHRWVLAGVVAGTLLTLASGMPAWAENRDTEEGVTFYRDVLPVLQHNCQTCHRPLGTNHGGMIAPMSFMTYPEVRPWAKAIARAIRSGEMPPWHASEDFHGVFSNERSLSREEIDTVLRWVARGAPAGRPEEAPPAPVRVEEGSGGWSIGKPDLVVAIEPFFVDDEVEDLNISFATVLSEEELPEDRWIQAIEYKAGSQVVHHICNVAIAPSPDGEPVDVDDPESFGRNGLGCIAPGTDARFLPDGFGTFLPKGATIRWGMHYHKERGPGTGVWDQSQMAFIFSRTPVRHRVKFDIIRSTNTWEIPPNHPNWEVGAARTFEEPTTILAYLPHMHFRGRGAEYRAFYPDGTEELLLRVPDYDYNWQTIYRYHEPKEVPAGTRIEVSMWYDNSPQRAQQARVVSDRAVGFGLPTTDEMMNGWIGYANTLPRDFDQEAVRTAPEAPESP